jgi:hypothetical protein
VSQGGCALNEATRSHSPRGHSRLSPVCPVEPVSVFVPSSLSQNANRSANCTMRGVFVVLFTTPNAVLVGVTFGAANSA